MDPGSKKVLAGGWIRQAQSSFQLAYRLAHQTMTRVFHHESLSLLYVDTSADDRKASAGGFDSRADRRPVQEDLRQRQSQATPRLRVVAPPKKSCQCCCMDPYLTILVHVPAFSSTSTILPCPLLPSAD